MKVLDAAGQGAPAAGASFSLGNRLFRVAWGVGWLVLARWTPPPLHGWRRLVLRLFGARLAPGARVHASVRVWYPPNLTLGADALVGPGVQLYNQGRIAIGARSVVSQGAYLCASTHDIADPQFQLVVRPITVGEGCWIAAEAFVGPGVSVGDGAVVAARAALFENARAKGVYRGNPAAWIKERRLRSAPASAR
ncbi:DapH/DapD/GlmU-related protein [Sphingomonas sp.]|jgi:putative colanic acid biosynthesis acetyltransferase WcaF|uniref:DapH/DapD/GlmU-related protein n=1 Tax=Sphingomonas sp. TaxID=28214 RepID=UPI002D7F98D9|nr:putative colanic acid biosynthesis acetyltransferase [Sphingomonas sp.]HEU0043733.1 putative colanic acid biosynthesis acetyltransferase [Sphingomonas sp.]